MQSVCIALAGIAAVMFTSCIGDTIIREVLVGVELLAQGAAYYWLLRGKKKTSSPREKIVEVLVGAGFECGITEDNDICIKLGDSPIFARVVELPGGKQRVHFSAMINVRDKKISEQGLNYMISQMNSHNDYYTMLLREDALECRVETVVDKAKDVLREMEFAVSQFGHAVKVMERNIGSVAEKYPRRMVPKGNKIGFVVPSVCKELPTTRKKKKSARKKRGVHNAIEISTD